MTMRKNHDTKLEIQRQPNQTQIKQNETKQNNQPNKNKNIKSNSSLDDLHI